MYKIERKLTEEFKMQIREDNGENFQLKTEKEILFLEKMDLGSQITFMLNVFLSFKLFEHYENHMVYPVHEANNSTKRELKKIAELHDINWVVNIPKVEFLVGDKGKSGRIRYQLYNKKSNRIVIDDILTVDDHNPGLEFSCKAGTTDCVINNLTSTVFNQVFRFLNKNKDLWR